MKNNDKFSLKVIVEIMYNKKICGYNNKMRKIGDN